MPAKDMAVKAVRKARKVSLRQTQASAPEVHSSLAFSNQGRIFWDGLERPRLKQIRIKQGPAGQRWVLGHIKQIQHIKEFQHIQHIKHFKQFQSWTAVQRWVLGQWFLEYIKQIQHIKEFQHIEQIQHIKQFQSWTAGQRWVLGRWVLG